MIGFWVERWAFSDGVAQDRLGLDIDTLRVKEKRPILNTEAL